MIPDPIGNHRVGWFPAHRLAFAEGHPIDGRLASPDELPDALDRLLEACCEEGLALPGPLARFATPDSPGFLGVRRLDSTCDLLFERAADGLAFLAGVAATSLPRSKSVAHREAGGRRVETVAFHGFAGGRLLARVYDKGVESGTAPRGTRVRLEDQRRWGGSARRDVDELTAEYVGAKHRDRFRPLWQASKGVTVGNIVTLGHKLGGMVRDGDLAPSRARSLAGYLVMESAGEGHHGARSTRLQLRSECRRHGLVLADGVDEDVEVDVASVMAAALETDAWARRG